MSEKKIAIMYKWDGFIMDLVWKRVEVPEK